jgi:hypothetical protein
MLNCFLVIFFFLEYAGVYHCIKKMKIDCYNSA